jgi:hypothetical protein
MKNRKTNMIVPIQFAGVYLYPDKTSLKHNPRDILFKDPTASGYKGGSNNPICNAKRYVATGADAELLHLNLTSLKTLRNRYRVEKVSAKRLLPLLKPEDRNSVRGKAILDSIESNLKMVLSHFKIFKRSYHNSALLLLANKFTDRNYTKELSDVDWHAYHENL